MPGEQRGTLSSIPNSKYYLNVSPGRFFAVNVMKALIAHIIVTYDFKFEEGKRAPDEHRMGLFRAPGNANMLFRKRQE
jgi:hypothetical protein